jgi:ABC-type multidrug transport system permease subunit
MSTPQQTLLLYARLQRQQLKEPIAWINVILALFFFAVYVGAFGGSEGIERIVGGDFLSFILPVTILNAAIAGSSAGQLLVTDLESGYLRRLLTLPVSRTALVLAPMLVGATLVLVQSTLVIGVGVLLGAETATGLLGLLVVLALALLWGLAFAGYSVASGLLAGNAAGAQAATFLFFPLIFVAPTFLPREALQGWLEVAASANPTTYVLEAMRGLLLDGWEAGPLLVGFAVILVLGGLSLLWATRVARGVTARG